MLPLMSFWISKKLLVERNNMSVFVTVCDFGLKQIFVAKLDFIFLFLSFKTFYVVAKLPNQHYSLSMIFYK